MDRVVFLNSSGGIVDLYGNANYIPSLKIAPYVETVMIPVVSVDSSALYGDHPENLAAVTYSSGAALTFFCDSVAGGSDSSGDGSFDNPWRSMNTASAFFACAECTLRAAAPYIQLKVKGTLDYLSGSRWAPWQYDGRRIIVTGWGEKPDFGGVAPRCQYAFGVRLPYADNGNNSGNAVYSGCEVASAWAGTAIDCSVASAAFSTAINCSGGEIAAAVLYGGSFASKALVEYAYSPTVNISGATSVVSYGVFVSSAMVGGSVTISLGYATAGSLGYAAATAVRNKYGALLADCTVGVTVAASTVNTSNAEVIANAVLCGNSTAVISGGRWTASARAVASGGSVARASAAASGFPSGTTLYGVPTTLTASAGAHVTPIDSGYALEYEATHNLGTCCYESRWREYSGGVVTSSSAGSRCDP